MERDAGIESTAKIKSVNSITTNTSNKGVAINLAFFRVKKFAPSYSSLIGTNLRMILTTKFFDKSASSSSRWKNILIPVKTKNAPNKYTNHSK